MTDNNTDNPTRHQIVEQLRAGDRDPIGDADEVLDLSDFGAEAIHQARNGSVAVQFELCNTYESTVAGGVYDFDLL